MIEPNSRTLTLRATALAAVCLAALSVASAQTFTIKAKSNAGGTISPQGVVLVPAGGSQTFTITPDTGYSIVKVVASKVDIGPVTTYTFENVQNKSSIKATFKIQSFIVTFSAIDGVTISPSVPKTLKYGKQAAVTVTPPKGSTAIPLLTVDGNPVPLAQSGGTYKYTLTVTGPHVLQASLTPRPALTVAKAGTGTGTVTSAPTGISCGATCNSQFDPGTVVTLTPTADAGSTFTGWAGGCTGTGACQVTLNADAAVTATFTISTSAQHTLTLSKSGTGTGTVSSNPAGITCGATCASLFDEATILTLTAAAGAGSTFTGWSGGGCGGTGTCQVTLNADTTVTAAFTLNAVQHTLTVSKSGTGIGTVSSNPAGITCGATCNHPFDEGSLITLTAAAGVNSTFAGWSGGGCSGTGTCQVTLSADKTVTATFTLSGGGGGLMLHVTDTCQTPAAGAIVAVHNPNGTVQQKFTVGATGNVDLSSFGQTVTFTVGWPNSMLIANAEIHSFVEVSTSLGTFTVGLEGGSCPPIDPKLGSVTIDLNPAPIFGIVDPLGLWLPSAKVLGVYQSDLQNDGSLTLLANTDSGSPGSVDYGYLLDQTFTNGAHYTINVDKVSSAIPFSAGNNISSLLISGQRKGVPFTLSQYLSLSSPAMSGQVEFFNQFPASTFNVFASAPFLFDTFGSPYSSAYWTRILSSAPASITIPLLFHVTDFTYNSGTVMSSWVLSENTAGKIGLIGFSNVQSVPTVDDRHWTIVLDPTTHSSWAESNLVLPSELDLSGRTAQGPSMVAYEFSYVHTYSDGLKSLYTGGVTPPAPPYDFVFTYRTVP